MLNTLYTLPQTLIGAILYLILRPKKRNDGTYEWNLGGGICLGKFIFVDRWSTETRIKHEKGHQKQSDMLGWLYLIVIGIPSFVWATMWTYIPYFHKKNYYKFYTESWADKLGGVNR